MWSKLSFATCTYLRSPRGARAKLVQRAIETWGPLLGLPFYRKIFLDDRSSSCSGIRTLLATNVADKFDEIHYSSLNHPPHSNFGIVMSYTLCGTEYVLHFDDDVAVVGSLQECRSFIEKMLQIMEEDPTIMGINCLTLDRKQFWWKPGKGYRLDPEGTFAHPSKLFGTCAGLIRRELLERVSLEDVVNWGSRQPATWEQLVSDVPASFLVAVCPTPFRVEDLAWTTRSTSAVSIRRKVRLAMKTLKT